MHKGLKFTALLGTAALASVFSQTTFAFTQNAELGQPFLHAEADHHQSNYTPDLAIDGSRSGRSRWQGQSGSHLTLDVGTAVDMAGVYVWLLGSSSRNYWLRIESSQDGENWISHWHGIATPKNANSKPVYLPLVTEQKSARYIRVTGFGNTIRNKNYVTEVRWLAKGEAVSSNRHVKQAHWYNDGVHSDDPKLPHFAPRLTAWSVDSNNILSVMAKQNSDDLDLRCPVKDLFILNPQIALVDMTGQLDEFSQSKKLPDGSTVLLVDWEHDKDQDLLYESWTGKADQSGTTLAPGSDEDIPFHTACYIESYPYFRGSNLDIYNEHKATGAHHEKIVENWDSPLIVNRNAANSFNESVSTGLAFMRNSLDTGGESPEKILDGYIDSGSRWSQDSADSSSSATTELTIGPAVTSMPNAQGLYLWMHRSDERWSKVSIKARADGEAWRQIATELVLPAVASETPVFIPFLNSGELNLKHVSITGLGSNNSSWTSIAEARYSDSELPDSNAVLVLPIQEHPIEGYAFQGASSNAGTTSGSNTPIQAIDGSIAPLNYWAAQGYASLTLELGSEQKLSALNVWMHRSSERSSNIDIVGWNTGSSSPALILEGIDIPVSADDESTPILLDEPVRLEYITLYFQGNSVNGWNSVSEVSWE